MEDKTNQAGRSAARSGEAGGERVVYVMPSDATIVEAASDEIDLVELWNTLWQSKWLIAGIAALFTVVGIAYALLATEWYRAEVLLAPAEEKTTQGLVGQLGGLAGLAGISIGGGGTAEPIAVLKSREFAGKFIKDLDLVTVLLADDWDAASNRWKAKNPEDWPDVRDAVKYFGEDVRSISEDRKTGLVTLAIRWTDPELASEWANLLVIRLNARMREQALVESERNVHYLQEQIASTNVVSLQQSIGRLLESEMQKLMLARGNEEFSFRVIDRAEPPKYRETPKRKLIVLLAAMAGGMLAVVIVLIRHSMRGRTIRHLGEV